MEHIDFSPLFALYEKVYVSGPCKTVEYFLNSPLVEKINEDDIVKVIENSKCDVTVLTDYDGNIAIHKLLSKYKYL